LAEQETVAPNSAFLRQQIRWGLADQFIDVVDLVVQQVDAVGEALKDTSFWF
jgi:hypothetical protein